MAKGTVVAVRAVERAVVVTAVVVTVVAATAAVATATVGGATVAGKGRSCQPWAFRRCCTC